jgi:hypothetical protein
MGGRAEYGKSKTDGEPILEGDRQTAKGETKSNPKQVVKGIFIF